MQGPKHKHRRQAATFITPSAPTLPNQMPAVVAMHYRNLPTMNVGPLAARFISPPTQDREALVVVDHPIPAVAIDHGLLRDQLIEKAIQSAPARRRSIVGNAPLIMMSPQHAAKYRPVVEISKERIKFKTSSGADRDAYVPDEMRAIAYDPFFNFGLLLHDIEGLDRDVELFTKGFIDKQRMKMATGGVVKIVAGIVHGATLGLTAPVTGPAFIAGDLLVTNAEENLRDRGAPDESGVAAVTGARGVAVGEVVKAVSPHLKSGLSQIPTVGATLAAGFVPVAGGVYNIGMGVKAIHKAYKYEGFDLNKEQRKLIITILSETREIMVAVEARGAEINEKSYLSLGQKRAYLGVIEQILASLKQIKDDALYAIKENNRVIAKRKLDEEMVLGAKAAEVAQKDAEERAARRK